MEYTAIDTQQLTSLRQKYLDGLPFSQEFFPEMNIAEARGFSWINGSERRAYDIINEDEHTLWEFRSPGITLAKAAEELKELIRRMELKKAFVKSFDSTLLNSLILNGYSPKPGGYLFRRWVETPKIELKDIQESLATEDDFQDILQNSEDFFEGSDELAGLLAYEGLWVYRNPRGDFLGCAIMQPVILHRPHWDIGMVTAPAFRRRGYASLMIQRMKEKVLERGYEPICGCDVRNTGSYKSLRRAGFREDHLLFYVLLFGS